MTSAARDLMDTGTAGEWSVGEITPGTWAEHIPAYADIEPLIAGGIDPGDARKIVLSVNALPLVDALCEAVQALAEADADTPGDYYESAVFAARDALEAALRGEG